MSNVHVEEAATAVATEIVSQIDASLAQGGNVGRRSFELLEASRGLDAEAAALSDPAEVGAHVERLRAQLAQLTRPGARAEQRQVMARAAERLRAVACGAGPPG